jgi:hypothetical protein
MRGVSGGVQRGRVRRCRRWIRAGGAGRRGLPRAAGGPIPNAKTPPFSGGACFFSAHVSNFSGVGLGQTMPKSETNYDRRQRGRVTKQVGISGHLYFRTYRTSCRCHSGSAWNCRTRCTSRFSSSSPRRAGFGPSYASRFSVGENRCSGSAIFSAVAASPWPRRAVGLLIGVGSRRRSGS